MLGLPHAAPLPDTVLLATRIENGTCDLYQIDTTTGAVGKKLTNGTPGPQFPIFSPDRGTVVYVQSGSSNQLRTMAVDGTGNRGSVRRPARGVRHDPAAGLESRSTPASWHSSAPTGTARPSCIW